MSKLVSKETLTFSQIKKIRQVLSAVGIKMNADLEEITKVLDEDNGKLKIILSFSKDERFVLSPNVLRCLSSIAGVTYNAITAQEDVGTFHNIINMNIEK